MKIDAYPESRFACRHCADGCCARFEVSVSPSEMAAIRKLHLPEVPPESQWFVSRPGQPDAVLAKNPLTGRCVFSDGNGCKIHSLYGYAAKPLSCRVFPLHIQQWQDGRISAEYRFICPAVGGETGDKLGSAEAEISRLAAGLLERRPLDQTHYSRANPAALERVRFVHEAFRTVLHEEKWPLGKRLYAAARILDFHGRRAMFSAVEAADARFAVDAREFLNKAEGVLASELAAGRLDALTRTNFRNMLCGFLRDDDPRCAYGWRFRINRALTQFLIVTGPGLLDSLNPQAPTAPGRVFPWRKPDFAFDAGAMTVFRQFFFGKLDAMHFCGGMVHAYTYEEGMRLLLVAACAAHALAAGYAWSVGERTVDRERMLRAVRLLDFTFARSPFFRLRAARRWLTQLTGPANFAGLIRGTICEGV